jgi:hypothetical protein
LDSFDDYVLDLTAPPDGPYKTHSKVVKETDWDENAAILQIGSGEISVFDYVQDLTNDPITLRGTSIRLQRLDVVGHWVKCMLKIPNEKPVTIQISGEKDIKLEGKKDTHYRIVINNDCSGHTKTNDMLMYYNVIRGFEHADVTDQDYFWVGAAIEPELLDGVTKNLSKVDRSAELKSIDSMLKYISINITGLAALAEGKPCMNIKVTKADDLPDFPA